MKQVYSRLTSSRTPAAMTLVWGANARGRRRYLGPIVFRPLRVRGFFCALTLSGVCVSWENSCGISLIVFEQPAKPFTTLQRAISFAFWARRRKEQDIALALMIALLMVMAHILVEHMP
jgi:hypothetical protein